MNSRVIYYDTETTGTRPESDRIVEIAAFDPETQKSFSQLVHPDMPIPPEATAIHRITDEMVADAPHFDVAMRAFLAFCSNEAILIAHNNDAFDRLFLEAECTRAHIPLPPWHYIDTLKWARKYRPDLPRHTLQHLREVYDVAANQAHRALADVQTLYRVFSLMIDDLPIQTVMELVAARPHSPKMPFGKYKGRPLSEIPTDYLRWLMQSGVLDKSRGNQDLKDLVTQRLSLQ